MTTRILLTCCMLCALTACSRNSIVDLAQSLKQLAEPKKLIIEGKSIFEYVTGQNETAFKKATNVTVVYDEKTGAYRPIIKSDASDGPFSLAKNGDFILTNAKNGRTYNAGQFETYTHESLKKEPQKIAGKKGTFNVVEIYWSLGAWLKLQYDAAARWEKPTFLAASNYDGIEEKSGTDDPTVASNIWDPTQGPAASLGALPGMLLRLYSQIREDVRVFTNYFDPNNPRVHMLKMTGLETQNGYVYFINPMHGATMSLPENFENILQGANYSCGIMYHKNISVTASDTVVSGNYFKSFTVPEPHPANTIDQIFAAGLSLGEYKTTLIKAYSDKPEETWIKNFAELLAQKILDDIFMLSVQAAAKNERDVLYLLPIGCGVFGNKHLWVGKALAKTKDLIINSGLTVKFIFGPGYHPNETIEEYNEFITILKQLAEDTGGTYKSL